MVTAGLPQYTSESENLPRFCGGSKTGSAHVGGAAGGRFIFSLVFSLVF